jgi:hypothetical protein
MIIGKLKDVEVLVAIDGEAVVAIKPVPCADIATCLDQEIRRPFTSKLKRREVFSFGEQENVEDDRRTVAGKKDLIGFAVFFPATFTRANIVVHFASGFLCGCEWHLVAHCIHHRKGRMAIVRNETIRIWDNLEMKLLDFEATTSEHEARSNDNDSKHPFGSAFHLVANRLNACMRIKLVNLGRTCAVMVRNLRQFLKWTLKCHGRAVNSFVSGVNIYRFGGKSLIFDLK